MKQISHVRYYGALFISVLFSFNSWSQTDTLFLVNNDVIVGEIKEMNRGVLIIETAYSDSDFKVEWEKITKLVSTQKYTVALKDRDLLTNALLSTPEKGKLKIEGEEKTREVPIDNIVYLRGLDDSFWSKMSASVDFGYSITKANNLRQFNADAMLGYKSKRWIIGGSYRQVFSTQDEVDPVRRIDGSLNADYSFKNGVFIGARLNFLSNTEQNLDLRTTGVIGAGYYLVRSNQLYWNVFAGPALNVENVGSVQDISVSPAEDRRSMEGLVATELNMYDVGDLNFFTNISWYPSLTEQSRNRLDYRLDIKYDLPLDFYVKAGFSYNYDSQPAAGASESDYVILTGFGWEL